MTFAQIPPNYLGVPALGTFVSLAALQAAKPAALNGGATALVNGVQYISESGVWLRDKARQGILFCTFGDSRAFEAGKGSLGYFSVSSLAFARAISGITFASINAGVGGNTVAQMTARVDADLYAVDPTDALVFGGHNDATAPTPPTVAAAWAGMQQILDGCISRGIYVHHCGEYIGPTDTAAQKLWKLAFNDRAVAYWSSRAGRGAFYDMHALVVSPLSATAAPKPNLIRDGIHFGIDLAVLLGGRIAENLTSRYAKSAPYAVSSVFDDASVNAGAVNKLYDPLFTSAGVGNAPTNCTVVVGTGTLTSEARADGIGNNLALTITNQNSFVQVNKALAPPDIPVGTRVFAAEIELVAPTNISEIVVRLFWDDGSSKTLALLDLYGTSAPMSAGKWYMVSDPFEVPAAILYGAMQIIIVPSGAGNGSGTIRLGRVSVV